MKTLETFETKDYKLEVVTRGTIRDSGFDITAIVFRANRKMINGWYDSQHDDYYYEMSGMKGSFHDFRENQLKLREAWESRVKELLGWHEDTGSITQNISEFFTAIFMKEVNQ